MSTNDPFIDNLHGMLQTATGRCIHKGLLAVAVYLLISLLAATFFATLKTHGYI